MNEKIRRAIISSNPWWKDTSWDIVYRPREVYLNLKKYISMKQIVSLIGLRRVGKTTILKKIISDYLKEGKSPADILFFSFDDFNDISIDELLTEYTELHKLDLASGRHYLFLDEIQKLSNWQDKIKRVYDQFTNLKIFISGSESLNLHNKESLAGRIFTFKVNPLTFIEYLDFKEVRKENIELYKKELIRSFEEYLYTGGFPEMVGITDREIIQRYIRETIIDKIIYKDIPQAFPIDEPSILKTIMDILIDSPGQIIEPISLSRELGISRQTISKYLSYLEMSFLIVKLYNFSRNRSTSEKKLKRYYISTPVLSLFTGEEALIKPKVIENIAVLKTQARFFWRNTLKDEVDIILEKEGKITPIEVKYKNKKEYAGLIKFMEAFKVKEGILLTKDIEGEDIIEKKKIICIPIWKYCLS